jgi:acyl-CoA thioesterase-1
MILIIVVALIILELVALAWLYFSVGNYKNFWANKSQESSEITYLALGDSAAQGIGATSPMRGYVGIIAKRLEEKTGKKVRVINLSVTGAKMSDYLEIQAPRIAEINADYVTIEIGANDIPTFDQNKFRSEFISVLESLPDNAYISNMPLFNSRPSSRNPAKEAGVIIEQEIRNYPSLNLADLQKQTSENQSIFGFAPDLFHPNNLSYKNWADAFWIQMEKELL